MTEEYKYVNYNKYAKSLRGISDKKEEDWEEVD